MAILGIIPARGGSKRVPRKNMRLLGGKPLVARSIELGLEATCLSRLVVSSDDPQVLALAATYSADLPLARPAEISGDDAPAIAYVRHALNVLESSNQPRFETIVILQPSSPFTLPADVDATVELLEKSGADSAVSVMEVDHAHHPSKFKVFDGDRLSPLFEDERGRTAFHELPKVYVRNGAVYAAQRHLIDAGSIFGADCRGYLMPRNRSLDINDEFDFAFAEFLLNCGGVTAANTG